MRAGASCAAQQTLSAEAAAVLKHSLTLARRRGHAQVTPLHVAATLLSSRASLLRRACLKSQPPQQPPHHHPLQCRALELCFNVALNRLPASPSPLLHSQPSLSNALVAALKRAQAHQRRGCVEQQQPPPLVSVKVELELLILSILDDPSVSRVMREAGFSSTLVKSNLDDCSASVFHYYNSSAPSSPPRPLYQPPQTTTMSTRLFDIMKQRRNPVVIADASATAEALVSHLIAQIENGELPNELNPARVVKFEFSSAPVALMRTDDVDMNVADLKRKVDSFAAVGRVVVYIGDLKWTVDRGGAAVDHLIAEIGKLIGWYKGTNMKVWLMATATHQTYVKCRSKLDCQWALQPLSLPSSPSAALGLALTLSAATPNNTSGSDTRVAFSENSSPVSEKKLFFMKEETDDVLTCCQECTLDYEKEAALRSIHHKSFSHKDHLPYWLKPHANKEDLDQLRRKYNKQCQNLHQNQSISNHHYYNTSQQHPCWSSKSSIFADSDTISFSYPAVRPGASTLPRFRRQQSCHIEFSFSNTQQQPNLDSLKRMEDKEVKITLALGRGGSCIDEVEHERVALHDLLKENLPWHLETIPSVVEALMSSRGKDRMHNFVVLHGNDNVAKRRVALAAAESILGSSDLLLVVNLRENERSGRDLLQRALRDGGYGGKKVVALVEDAEFADAEMVKLLADGSEAYGDSVFILATDCEANPSSVIRMKLVVGESTVSSPDHKRRAEWESGRGKRQRSNETEEVSSNGLDLNVRADEDEVNPISSDLTREVTMEGPRNTRNFLEGIKNRVALNRGSEEEREAGEMVRAEFKRAFEEAGRGRSLEVEEKVVEQVLRGCGLYLNGLFGKWLKDIFQTSLNGINCGERVRVRLCLVGEGEREKDGFKGTCLPKRIPVSYIG